jgi:hypothetical protein
MAAVRLKIDQRWIHIHKDRIARAKYDFILESGIANGKGTVL